MCAQSVPDHSSSRRRGAQSSEEDDSDCDDDRVNQVRGGSSKHVEKGSRGNSLAKSTTKRVAAGDSGALLKFLSPAPAEQGQPMR
jgi:hypothetical protein